jgi:hypothetical protein
MFESIIRQVKRISELLARYVVSHNVHGTIEPNKTIVVDRKIILHVEVKREGQE